MKSKVSYLFPILLACNANAATASPLSEQGMRMLLGEPIAEIEPPGSIAGTHTPASLSLNFYQPLGTLTNFFGNLNVATPVEHPFRGLTENGITAIQGGIEWFITQQQKMQWFLLGGMGGMLVNGGNKPDVIQPMVSFGVGQNWAIGTNDSLRWEVRANQQLGNESLPNWTPVNFQAIFSYQWGQ